MKRYAIVRVEHMCPALTEKGINICKTDKNCRNKCPYRYGDTKEQLIRKIETAVAIMRNKMENKEVYLDRAVASFILEFLGVE